MRSFRGIVLNGDLAWSALDLGYPEHDHHVATDIKPYPVYDESADLEPCVRERYRFIGGKDVWVLADTPDRTIDKLLDRYERLAGRSHQRYYGTSGPLWAEEWGPVKPREYGHHPLRNKADIARAEKEADDDA
jgi:hypothetical protein